MRKKTNFDQKLLNEELNRFRLLENYSFYTEQKGPEFNDETDEDDLLLGDLSEEEEDPNADANDIANELGIDEPTDSQPEGDTPPEDMGNEIPPAEEPAPIEEPVDDGIEVDVTELVNGSEEAKEAADRASRNSELLMQKLSDLESKISSMDAVSDKISELEKEIVKRNPTPVEKLEMRSLSSYPYSQKLTDYWADKEGPYDVMDNEKEEYILTQDDVDNSYSEADVKQSFTVKDEYDEEDI